LPFGLVRTFRDKSTSRRSLIKPYPYTDLELTDHLADRLGAGGLCFTLGTGFIVTQDDRAACVGMGSITLSSSRTIYPHPIISTGAGARSCETSGGASKDVAYRGARVRCMDRVLLFLTDRMLSTCSRELSISRFPLKMLCSIYRSRT
jgi:hypothetical protein